LIMGFFCIQSRYKFVLVAEIPEKEPATIRLWDSKRGIGLEARIYAFHTGKKPDQKDEDSETTTKADPPTPKFRYEHLPLTKSETDVNSGTQKARETTNQLAYNAAFKVPTNKDGVPRSATFVAAIRFFEGPRYEKKGPEDPEVPTWKYVPDSRDWPDPPTPREIFRHVGVSLSSEKATGAMWDTIFIERLMKSDSDLDLDEVNLIGRSLEKILQVDLVPDFFGESEETEDQQKTAITNGTNRTEDQQETITAHEQSGAEGPQKAATVNGTDRTEGDTEPPQKTATASGPHGTKKQQKLLKTAVVSNLFLRQNVDLEALL
jgi:hypothetical protein